MGDASLTIAGYSIITILYPEQKMIYLGYCSTARGLGCMLGPILGQIIYSMTGYDFFWTFILFSGVIACFMINAFINLPNTLNLKREGKID